MKQLAIAFALCGPSVALSAEASVGEIRACFHGKVAHELKGIASGKFGDSLVLDVENTLHSLMNARAGKIFGTVGVHDTPSVPLADARETETRIGRKLPVDAGLDEMEVTFLDVADAQAHVLVGATTVTGWPEKRSTEECLS